MFLSTIYKLAPFGQFFYLIYHSVELSHECAQIKCVINFRKYLRSHIQRTACVQVFMPKWLSAIDFCFTQASLNCFITFNRKSKIDKLTIKERPINIPTVHINCIYVRVCMTIWICIVFIHSKITQWWFSHKCLYKSHSLGHSIMFLVYYSVFYFTKKLWTICS